MLIVVDVKLLKIKTLLRNAIATKMKVLLFFITQLKFFAVLFFILTDLSNRPMFCFCN